MSVHNTKLSIHISKIVFVIFIASSIIPFGCDDFLHVDIPQSRTPSTLVFSDPTTATSAVTGIYIDMLEGPVFSSGAIQSITALAGLSADELINYPQDADFVAFQENSLAPINPYIASLWNSFYKIIYEANAVIEGLNSSTGISESIKARLRGECLFVRAFSYFYLVNTFGAAPLTVVTDYEINQKLPRASEEQIYEQILVDIVEAQNLLPDEYSTTTRIRPNKSTATALLARIYLYRKEWSKAITESSKVLASTEYQLEPNLNDVFLTASREAIWQLANASPNYNTNEGMYFIIDGSAQYNILRPVLIDAFEDSDDRLTSWIGTFDTGSEFLYYPFKYKKYLPVNLEQGEQVTEYSMVFRLAEQYLIRAEAEAQLGDLTGAVADVDMIRVRAGLVPIAEQQPSITQSELLAAIAHERRVELFTEWGHRWYDLKRTNMTGNVLENLKQAWNSEDTLYPIPQTEFSSNPQLGQQNPGY